MDKIQPSPLRCLVETWALTKKDHRVGIIVPLPAVYPDGRQKCLGVNKLSLACWELQTVGNCRNYRMAKGKQ